MTQKQTFEERVLEILGQAISERAKYSEIEFHYGAIPWETASSGELNTDNTFPQDFIEQFFKQAGIEEHKEGDFLRQISLISLSKIKHYCKTHGLTIPLSFNRASFLNTENEIDCLEIRLDTSNVPPRNLIEIIEGNTIQPLIANGERPIFYGPYKSDRPIGAQRITRDSISFFVRPFELKKE